MTSAKMVCYRYESNTPNRPNKSWSRRAQASCNHIDKFRVHKPCVLQSRQSIHPINLIPDRRNAISSGHTGAENTPPSSRAKKQVTKMDWYSHGMEDNAVIKQRCDTVPWCAGTILWSQLQISPARVHYISHPYLAPRAKCTKYSRLVLFLAITIGHWCNGTYKWLCHFVHRLTQLLVLIPRHL